METFTFMRIVENGTWQASFRSKFSIHLYPDHKRKTAAPATVPALLLGNRRVRWEYYPVRAERCDMTAHEPAHRTPSAIFGDPAEECGRSLGVQGCAMAARGAPMAPAPQFSTIFHMLRPGADLQIRRRLP
jgi:hypothetical protein